jgi:hypothetical protein
MKKLIIVYTISILCPNFLIAQYRFNGRVGGEMELEGGYKFIANQTGTFHAAKIDIVFHETSSRDYVLTESICGEFAIGKDYVSFSPGSLFMTVFAALMSINHYVSIEPSSYIAILGFPSSQFNIHCGDYIEISPYMDLFKVTKMDNDKLRLNGAVGLQLGFPLGPVSLKGFAEYGYGYRKNSGFKGFAFGGTFGVRLFRRE